jgi:asparagine synthase (glutamine-hydrolysing)
MCGIAAILGSPGERSGIERALDALGTRGPDGRGSWRSPDGGCALGHTRLAIRGGASGSQPIVSEDGAVTAVVNGELYGVEALRAALRGHRFRSDSDSELVVHLYEEHGERLTEHLRGEFAFLLWDARARRLVAARDPFGIKPLVYARHEGAWLLASRAAALFALGVPARLDEQALCVAARLQYLPVGRTLFEGVRVLPAGHVAVFEGDAVTLTPSARAAPEEDGTLRERLGRAVRERLEADAEIAFLLSGGIDSAAVLALAERERPRAFTVSFPGAREDEAALARATAAHLGAELTVIEATAARLAEAWPAAARAGEGLAVNAHLPAKWLLMQAVAGAGVRVVLGGEGADEVLYGYPHLVVDGGITPTSEHAGSRGLMLPSGAGAALEDVGLGFVPTFLRAKAEIGAVLAPVLRPAPPFDAAALLLEGIATTGEPADVSAALWSALALEGYILRTLGDGMEMAHGVEGRLPFLDGALAAWLATLPAAQKLGDGLGKRLLRDAMEGVLPDAVRLRPKHPFVAPPCEGPLLDVCADVLGGARFAAQGVFDPTRALAIVDRARAADAATRKELDPALWILGTLGLILEGLTA